MNWLAGAPVITKWKSSVARLGVPVQDMRAPVPTEFGEVEQYSTGSGHWANELFAVSVVRARAASGRNEGMFFMSSLRWSGDRSTTTSYVLG
jgi:hypothetical protein